MATLEIRTEFAQLRKETSSQANTGLQFLTRQQLSIFKKKRLGVICHRICKMLFLALITGMVKVVQIRFVTSLQPVTNVREKLVHEKVP